MAGVGKESGGMSLFDKGVKEMLEKLDGDLSVEARYLREQAVELRTKAGTWNESTSLEERKQATDELFTLFRRVMGG